MNNTFSSQTLAEKLSKLNSSQQSIETLSKWCILHRKKAKQIVEKWEKLFNSSPMEQRTSFLYLANDIIQNSKRKGSEFVNEFWKVLPGALKNVCENGDDLGKKAVTRLVGIWDERKVFGSRRRGLKEEILGKVPPPPLSDNNGNNSNPIKVVRKDANSLRIKLAVGGMPEKIITSYQRVLDEHSNEDTALNKCKAAVSHIQKMEKDVTDACIQGIQEGSLLMIEVQKQETILKDCIDQLVSVETSRAALTALLKEALQEQELELELISGQLQVARAETERASSIKQILVSAMTNTIPDRIPSLTSGPNPSTTSPPVQTSITEPNLYFQTPSTIPSQPLPPLYSFSSVSAPLPHLSQQPTPFINSLSSLQPEPSETVTSFTNFLTTATPRIQLSLPVTTYMNTTAAPPPPSPTVTSFTDSASADEQNKRAAAALAEKLTASASSAEVLTSVLSSLVAEEAASMNSGLGRGVFTSNPHIFPVNKRAKLEKPISISDTNNGFFGHLQPQQMQLPQVLPTSIQSQTNQLPPPPPLPPSQTNQTLPSPPLPPSRTNQTLPSPPLPPSQTNQPRPPPPPPLPMMPPPPPPPPVQQHVQSNGAMVGIAPYSYRGNALPPPPPPLPPVPPPQQHQQFSTMTGFFQQ